MEHIQGAYDWALHGAEVWMLESCKVTRGALRPLHSLDRWGEGPPLGQGRGPIGGGMHLGLRVK